MQGGAADEPYLAAEAVVCERRSRRL